MNEKKNKDKDKDIYINKNHNVNNKANNSNFISNVSNISNIKTNSKSKSPIGINKYKTIDNNFNDIDIDINKNKITEKALTSDLRQYRIKLQNSSKSKNNNNNNNNNDYGKYENSKSEKLIKNYYKEIDKEKEKEKEYKNITICRNIKKNLFKNFDNEKKTFNKFYDVLNENSKYSLNLNNNDNNDNDINQINENFNINKKFLNDLETIKSLNEINFLNENKIKNKSNSNNDNDNDNKNKEEKNKNKNKEIEIFKKININYNNKQINKENANSINSNFYSKIEFNSNIDNVIKTLKYIKFSKNYHDNYKIILDKLLHSLADKFLISVFENKKIYVKLKFNLILYFFL